MNALIGVFLALAICAGATWTGFGRDRSFYPVMVIVVASYYALFAVLSGSLPVLGWELLFTALFAAAAIAGFRRQGWLVVAALAVHGVFDLLHPLVLENTGVPPWWPAFCLGFDLVAACYLAAQKLYAEAGA